MAAHPLATPVRRGRRGPRRPDAHPHLRRPELRGVRWTASSRPGSSTPTCGCTSTSTSARTGGSASTPTGCPPCCSRPPAAGRVWPAPTGSPTARDRGDLIVVASNGGSDRPPAWLLNIQARSPGHRAGGPAGVRRPRPGWPARRSRPSCGRRSTGPTGACPGSSTPASPGGYDVYQRHTSRRIPWSSCCRRTATVVVTAIRHDGGSAVSGLPVTTAAGLSPWPATTRQDQREPERDAPRERLAQDEHAEEDGHRRVDVGDDRAAGRTDLDDELEEEHEGEGGAHEGEPDHGARPPRARPTPADGSAAKGA